MSQPTQVQHSEPAPVQSPKLVVRLLLPSVFLLFAILLVWGIKVLLQEDEVLVDKPERVASAGSVKPILPEDEKPVGASKDPETVIAKEPDMPEIAVPPVKAEDAEDAVDGGIVALGVLENFLKMKTLEERMPHLESKLSGDELAASILAGPLPEVLSTTVDVRETNSIVWLASAGGVEESNSKNTIPGRRWLQTSGGGAATTGGATGAIGIGTRFINRAAISHLSMLVSSRVEDLR